MMRENFPVALPNIPSILPIIGFAFLLFFLSGIILVKHPHTVDQKQSKQEGK